MIHRVTNLTIQVDSNFLWHQNKSSILVWGQCTKMQPLFSTGGLNQSWMVTLYCKYYSQSINTSLFQLGRHIYFNHSPSGSISLWSRVDLWLLCSHCHSHQRGRSRHCRGISEGAPVWLHWMLSNCHIVIYSRYQILWQPPCHKYWILCLFSALTQTEFKWEKYGFHFINRGLFQFELEDT